MSRSTGSTTTGVHRQSCCRTALLRGAAGTPQAALVIEGVLRRDHLLSWCMTSNQLPGAGSALALRSTCRIRCRGSHQPLLRNALIALCDFTADNGATQAVPGSHRWPERPPPYPEGKPVEINAGARVDSNGSLWHNAAANRTDARGRYRTINFCVGFAVRQQSDQQLSILRELVRCFEPRLQDRSATGPYAGKDGPNRLATAIDYLTPTGILF